MTNSINETINFYQLYLNSLDKKHYNSLMYKAEHLQEYIPKGTPKNSPLHEIRYLQRNIELELAISASEFVAGELAPSRELQQYHYAASDSDMYDALNLIKQYNAKVKKYGLKATDKFIFGNSYVVQ